LNQGRYDDDRAAWQAAYDEQPHGNNGNNRSMKKMITLED
jgi:hypothetical protein